ncbi:MAG: rhodanese-like domain-containing protein [Desulfobacterales bacterium]|jgi:rhodanese-related sulfurtransferase|nr:rhodanese-like domain-containing protein [Desulfobacterales bacterium]
MVIRKSIKEIIILVSVSVALALVVNTLSPRGIALVGQWDITKGVITASPAGDAAGQKKEIDSVARAKTLFDKGDVLFVDARSQNQYGNGHIPGAVSLPVGQFEERIESFLNRYPPEQPIVTYCSGRTCEDSHDLAQFLSDVGFNNVRIFIDGFPGWEAEGYPIE